MRHIPLRLALPGMILAQPVTRPGGAMLLGMGTTLTATLIDRLAALKVDDLTVVCASDMNEDTAAMLAQKTARLEHLFRNFKQDAFMQDIKTRISQYYKQRCAETEGTTQGRQ